MTRTAIASFEAPRFFWDKEEQGMANSKQKRILENFIMQNIEDEEKREFYLKQIHDITETEANDWIMEFEMGMWR